MKKYGILIISIALIFIVLAGIYNAHENNTILKNTHSYSKSNNYLSMMLETGAETGEYVSSEEAAWPTSGYSFNATLSKCENGSEVSWDDVNKKVVVKSNNNDKCYVYFDMESRNLFADYIKRQYTNDGANGLYFHDGEGAYGPYEDGDNSYRYSGTNPSNYVCFGYDDATGNYADNWCPEENQYRIIGLFDSKVKLIKKTSVGDKVWDADNSNTWSTSDMKNYLNGEYLTGLGEYANMIVSTTWIVGGNSNDNIILTAGVNNVYNAETLTPNAGGSTDTKTEDTFKVGLMYVSDYMYAADPTQANAWSALTGYHTSDATKDYRAVTGYNWMYLGSKEWTITRFTSPFYTFIVNNSGNLIFEYVNLANATRPSFYLDTSVTYGGGEGTSAQPYIIGM